MLIPYKSSIVLSSYISTAPQEHSPERAGVCVFAALRSKLCPKTHNAACVPCVLEVRVLTPISDPVRPTVHRVLIAVWMSVSASDAAGKFAAIFLPISAFVAMGLDHSVANM